ncbi:TetR/AcrR family transcriptional regulator [Clostridiaceae bacterium DONG20-135]|uniref:TetR/AcrR family transcriptional regulator n=1 Tax=Copranaerobaculum intestinale TaxID=2692629 RepID=A0A6N8U510_9FIRM|nr:TetR/AcrR family transcriptional regulator [Copranaerobaculum intestinale]MXQ73162.1 TetR/AcrR family transcriptional regulator [Copranaerobaculum intestinale]
MNKQPEVTAATRKKFMDAFWIIYKEKTIDKITIAEITRMTNNNRGTFYHYFKDVYAVLEQIEKDLIDEVHSEISEVLCRQSIKNDSIDINFLYSISMPIFKKHEDKIFTLLGKNGDPNFTNEFKENFRSTIIQFWNLSDDIEHLDYLMEFSYSSMFALMAKWYENGNDLTDSDFFKMAQGLVANGLIGYLKKQQV